MIQNTSITVNAAVEDGNDTVLLADVPAECAQAKPEGFSISDENAANWLIKKIVAARQYGERVKLWAAQEIARSERDEDRLLYLFGGQLERWVTVELQKSRGRRRSISLPAGTVGWRHQRTKLVVENEEAVIQWALNNCPQAVQTIQRLLKTPMNEHFEQTGEIPDSGAILQSERDVFFIR